MPWGLGKCELGLGKCDGGWVSVSWGWVSVMGALHKKKNHCRKRITEVATLQESLQCPSVAAVPLASSGKAVTPAPGLGQNLGGWPQG